MINKNNIDKIEFILENCEVVTIPIKNISNFQIHINDNNKVDNLTMTIKDDNNIDGYIFDKIRPFARLSIRNDITWIKLYAGNQIKKYAICWDDDDEYSNAFQHTNLIDAYTLDVNINTYKSKFPDIDIEEKGELIHIDNKEMLKVYSDFVMVDKKLFNDILLIQADNDVLYRMIN